MKAIGRNLATCRVSRDPVTGFARFVLKGDQGTMDMLVHPVGLVELLDEALQNGGYLNLRVKVLEDVLPGLLSKAKSIRVPRERASLTAGEALDKQHPRS